MNDWERAKSLLKSGSNSCVIIRDEDVLISQKRGIAPLVDLLQEKRDLSGYSAADKIVGKAAAMLFILLGVQAVYAPVMSKTAVQLFKEQGIEVENDTVVDTIINRKGTGSCPMESTVASISDPQKAFKAIQDTLKRLQIKKGE